MRKFLYLLFCMLFVSCSKTNLVKSIENDCEYLKQILPDASIDFSNAVDAGLDVETFINEVKLRYANYAENDRKDKYEKPDENGIYNSAFTDAITYTLQNHLKRKNTHMTIKGKYAYIAHSYVNRVFLSDIFFEKSGDDFFVLRDFNSEISEGMKYTGDLENIVLEYINGDFVYRFVFFSEKLSLDKAKISLDNNTFIVPVRRDELVPRKGKDLWYEEKDGKLYVIASTFKPHLEKNIEDYEITLEEICEKINNYSTVVFDFRDNAGGYSDTFTPVIASMLFGTSDYEAELYDKIAENLILAKTELLTETVRNSYLLDGQILDYTYYGDKGIRYNTLKSEEERFEIDTPAFNGKIFIITNTNTVSAAEMVIAELKYYFKDKVCILGEKSAGMLDFGGVFSYILPDSKIRINLCHVDNTGNAFLSVENGWKGDTKGFYPDYWIFEENSRDIDGYINSNSF